LLILIFLINYENIKKIKIKKILNYLLNLSNIKFNIPLNFYFKIIQIRSFESQCQIFCNLIYL